MKLQWQIDDLVSRQASGWIETLRTGGVKERAAFVAWLKASRHNVEEFMAMVAVDRELNSIDAAREHDLQALLMRIAPQATPLRPGDGTRMEQRSRRKLRALSWSAAIAASLLVCALSVWFVRENFWSWRTYSTAIGEQRAVELADGSLVYLNTLSTVKVRFNEAARDIRLASGEALFKVARDPARPFKVYTRNAAVQAVGTQFNVYTRNDRTTVTVLEGKVRVSAGADVSSVSSAPAPLSAGEEAKIGGNGQISRSTRKDAEKAVAWRERRLVFNDDTLEDMVAEFNRYNLVPQFRLEGKSVKQRHYSGTFDADDPESLAALLSRENEIEVETTTGEIIVRPAR